MVKFNVDSRIIKIWGPLEVSEINRSLDRLGNLRVPISVKTDIRKELEPLINKLLENLQEVLNKLSSIADGIISQSKEMVKDLISLFFDDLNRIITDIWEKVEALWSRAEELCKKLVEEFLKFVDDISERIYEFESKLLTDLRILINDAIDKGRIALQGTLETVLSAYRNLAIDWEIRFPWQPDYKRDKECRELHPNLKDRDFTSTGVTHPELYTYLDCMGLLSLRDGIKEKQGSFPVYDIRNIYIGLQARAWELSTLGRSEDALQKMALENWVYYGQLAKLWDEVLSCGGGHMPCSGIEFLDAINRQVNELRDSINECKSKTTQIVEIQKDLQAKSAEINSLKDELANGRIADGLHKHSTLTGSGSSPDPALSVDNLGDVIIFGNLGTHGHSPTPRSNWAGGIHTWDIEADGTIFSEHGIVGGETTTTTGWALGRGAWGPDNWLRLTTKHGGDTYHDLAVNHFWAADATRFDLAEVTPVKVEDQLEQGDVVVIDEEDGFRVKRSRKSYDTSVYGIVSSYESAAMIIGGAGPETVIRESGKLPIALIGRVKAKVSAEAGAIQVGNLLTTSSTQGHLMKCNNISKSTGAVVGKALEPFKGDKGMITILVTLQ